MKTDLNECNERMLNRLSDISKVLVEALQPVDEPAGKTYLRLSNAICRIRDICGPSICGGLK